MNLSYYRIRSLTGMVALPLLKCISYLSFCFGVILMIQTLKLSEILDRKNCSF